MKIVVTGPGIWRVLDRGQAYAVGSTLEGQVYCGRCLDFGCRHVRAVEKRAVKLEARL